MRKMNSEERMLHDIGIADFVLTDLMLYLDTHPTDRNAMEYFNHYTRIKTQMEREFSREYYPLRKDLAERNGIAAFLESTVCARQYLCRGIRRNG